jgi:hypothetical protein
MAHPHGWILVNWQGYSSSDFSLITVDFVSAFNLMRVLHFSLRHLQR